MSDYSEIDNPYDGLLNRSSNVSISPTQSQNTGTTSQDPGSNSNGSVESVPVKTDGALNNVWISTWIKSTSYRPKRGGFYIDGRTGYAEFTNVTVIGSIIATGGTIGGWTIGTTTLSGNKIILDSAGLITAGVSGGQRVVVNGINNRLDFYNSSDTLVGSIIGLASITIASSTNFYFFGPSDFSPFSTTDLGTSISAWNDLWLAGDIQSVGDINSNGIIGSTRYVLPGAVSWTSGSGSPEGVVTAVVGSLYSRTNGGASTTLYVKQSGTGNTGWSPK